MKILLLGEYSGFHNSLKAGLVKLGHEVVIAGNGDHFKKYPVDINLEATILTHSALNVVRQGIFRLFSFDIATVETALRFKNNGKQLKDFDVVQLVNEYPLKTNRKIELQLLKFIFKHNKNVFLSACGDDFHYISFLHKKTQPYSVLSPLFKNEKLKSNFKYSLEYLSDQHQKLHQLVFRNTKGVISGDMDYKIAYDQMGVENHFVPFPVNLEKFKDLPEKKVEGPIVIFHGINRVNYYKKGNDYFESALQIIKQKYGEKIKIITAENLAFKEYIESYHSANILLDQIHSYDQGYNALEAMAKGKVVFTGAETEFLEYYNLKEDEVCINALPNVEYLVNKLSWLIDNPKMIIEIGENARDFVLKEHHYIRIAEKYLQVWSSNN